MRVGLPLLFKFDARNVVISAEELSALQVGDRLTSVNGVEVAGGVKDPHACLDPSLDSHAIAVERQVSRKKNTTTLTVRLTPVEGRLGIGFTPANVIREIYRGGANWAKPEYGSIRERIEELILSRQEKMDAHEELELDKERDPDDPAGEHGGDDDDDLDYMENVIVVYRPASLPIPESSAFTAVPCGVCPVFQECAPGGLVSPETCQYMQDWLSF